mgnify:CR=1 FL=1
MNITTFICLFLFISYSHCFIPKFNSKHITHFYDTDKTVKLENKHNLFSNFTGFYGLIGPNMDFNNANSLMELFTGDGVVQGIFIDNGNITFQNHLIQTEKLLFEKLHGNVKLNIFTLVLSMLKLFPNISGTANTAIHKFQNNTLALYETDCPYILNVDQMHRKISTVGKQPIKNVKSISAHSKFKDNCIETISYDVITKRVYFLN